MNINDARKIVALHVAQNHLEVDGDNRKFIVEHLIPFLPLRPEVRQVIRWAYGYDGADRSYEMESDGSTVVPDWFMMKRLKEPPGVGHDYLNRVEFHVTPDLHMWTAKQSCDWYRMALIDFGYTGIHALNRWFWLILTIPFWWKRIPRI